MKGLKNALQKTNRREDKLGTHGQGQRSDLPASLTLKPASLWQAGSSSPSQVNELALSFFNPSQEAAMSLPFQSPRPP